MATITISAADVADAQNFLEQFLSDENPDGNFSKGTALADLTVNALAAVFAYLTSENGLVKSRQSLKTIREGVVDADPASLLDAATALLSNWFIPPKAGKFSRGVALAHISQQVDVFIQPTHRFTRTPGAVFQVDTNGEVFYVPKTDLLPIFDTRNVVIEYQFRIPLVALAVGEGFNVDPGVFSDFDKFSPYVTFIENTTKFDGGKGPETTQELIDRSSTAVSVRNLINDRSITAVLGDIFGDTVDSVLVIGMGEPEMQRDRLTGVAPHLALHLGGAADIYILAPLIEASFTGVVGGMFFRPDNIINLFRDATVPDWTLTGVQVGDILRIYAGLPGVPREFLIDGVTPGQLFVSERVYFPIATDELVPPTTVNYTIGRNAPGFFDVVSNGGTPVTTGVTSRQIGISGAIIPPGGPMLRFLDVAIIDPPGGEAAFKDPVDGYVHFPDHVNTTPVNLVAPTQPLQFQTEIHNPDFAQSAYMAMIFRIGPNGNIARYDGTHLRVRYLTLSNFAALHAFVSGRQERTVCAFQVVRAHNPVELRMSINYRLAKNASGPVDNAAVAQTVTDYINAFDTSAAPIDVSSIATLIKQVYPSIAAVFPFNIDYTVFAPTGEVIDHTTSDEVLLDSAHRVSPSLTDLSRYGVSSRTVRYLTVVDNIAVKDIGP